MRLMSLVLALAGLLPQCSHAATMAEGEAFPYAIARRGCTQEDAPALEVYLSKEPFDGRGLPRVPYLRLEVAWADWPQITGRSLVLMPLSRSGLDPKQHVVRAELNEEEQKPPTWLAGSLVLRSVEADRRVSGSYDLRRPDGRIIRGMFEAGWQRSRPGCG